MIAEPILFAIMMPLTPRPAIAVNVSTVLRRRLKPCCNRFGHRMIRLRGETMLLLRGFARVTIYQRFKRNQLGFTFGNVPVLSSAMALRISRFFQEYVPPLIRIPRRRRF